ncbi:hypothetical protein [Sphingomonas xinjiangensis]|uniref:Putative membrane protein n=1 Tax=Sphingomonas xinjiangensis TaxID=643568 RepID=A0A840YPK7_9SPHN|nr:hypothetical protein [Sphingomonas xinjiangensis]MBB5710201.1 putative membrane protein [Sphingomonas xinjiangensis]
MASKKKKAEERTAKPAKGAKPEKTKGVLPKSINGAKLPKDVREKLTDLAKHPVVADLIAAGLVALAARLKNEPKVKEGASKAVSKALDAGAGTGQDMAHLAANIATAVVAPVVKRIRTAATEAATVPADNGEAAAPAAPNPVPANTSTPPVRRRKAEPSTAAKPRAARRPTSKPAAPQETDDA